MDMSMIGGLLAAQGSNLQTQIATQLLKSDFATEKSTVLTLLGAGQPSASSAANLASGIGGQLDVTA
jgi:hypothetical protein